MESSAKSKSPSASETLENLMEMSRLLNTGLTEETMAICVRLCENGINPETLAQVIQELRKESVSINQSQ